MTNCKNCGHKIIMNKYGDWLHSNENGDYHQLPTGCCEVKDCGCYRPIPSFLDGWNAIIGRVGIRR